MVISSFGQSAASIQCGPLHCNAFFDPAGKNGLKIQCRRDGIDIDNLFHCEGEASFIPRIKLEGMLTICKVRGMYMTLALNRPGCS